MTGPIGFIQSTAILGAVIFGLAIWAVRKLPETYGRDLDFEESI